MASDPITLQRRRQAVFLKSDFDPDESKYLCCCGCCHVTTGVRVIGVLEGVLLVAQLVIASMAYIEFGKLQSDQNVTVDTANSYVYYGAFAKNPGIMLAAGIWSTLVGLVVIALMLVGIRTLRPAFLVPHLICQILAVIGLLAACGMVLHGVVTMSDHIGTANRDARWTALVVLLTILALVLLAVGAVVYFMFVIMRCYKFLKARRHYEKAISSYAFMYNGPHQEPTMGLSAPLFLPSASVTPRPSTSDVFLQSTFATPRPSTNGFPQSASITPRPSTSGLFVPSSSTTPTPSTSAVQYVF